MKRSMLYVLSLVLAFSLVFISCASAVTLKLLDYGNIATPEGRSAEEVIEAFLAANPDIELQVERLYDETYHQKLAALAAAGELPDVMYLWPGGARSGPLMEAGLIADLCPLLGADVDKWLPTVTAPQMDGKLYELPISAGTATHVMMANTKILEGLGLSIPQSYAELKAMVPTITAAGMDPIIQAGDAWVMQSVLFGTLVARIAGDNWLVDAAAGRVAFTDKAFIDSLNLLKEIYDTGLLPVSSIQLGYGDVPALFTEGRGVFFIDGSWRVGAVAELLTDEQEEDIELMVFPDIAGQRGSSSSTSLVTSTGLGIKAGLSAEKAAAAIKLVKFYAGPEAAKIRMRAGFALPPSCKDVDLSDVELAVLTKKLFAFFADHPVTPVFDAVITGDPMNRVNIGLQEFALGDITAEQLAAEIEAAR